MRNLLALLVAGGLGACTSSAATTGTGGSAGAATTGTGGTSSEGGAGGAGNGIVCQPAGTTSTLTPADAVACPKPAASGLISDFTFPADAGVPDGGAPPRFGDDSTVLSGGGSTFANTPGMIVTSDSSMGDWHIKTDVANYAGFSLYFDDVPNAAKMPCNVVDATGFTGISFTIWGDTAGNPITMSMGIVDDTPTAAWFQSIGVTFTAGSPLPAGACIPNPNGMQYYHPGCGDPTAPAFMVTGTQTAPQTVTFKWTDFINGACMPNVIADQIVSVAWQFAWSATTTPYTADIHIDNLTFTTN